MDEKTPTDFNKLTARDLGDIVNSALRREDAVTALLAVENSPDTIKKEGLYALLTVYAAMALDTPIAKQNPTAKALGEQALTYLKSKAPSYFPKSG